MPGKTEVLILGGGYGGLMAAARLSRRKHLCVTLVDRKPAFQQRIRWHQVAVGDAVAEGDFRRWLKPAGVSFVQGEVMALDLARRQAFLADGGTLAFEHLVYALGSEVSPHPDGVAWQLSSQEKARALQARWAGLASAKARVVLVGGGLTQLETAAELAERFPALRLQWVSRSDPFTSFHVKARNHFERTFARLGVEILAGHDVETIEHRHLRLRGGDRVEFDACLAATGFQVPPLARQSGLRVNEQGRIEVNEHLASLSHPFVWAAGDAAACSHTPDALLRMSCATALPMGAQVGDNLAATVEGAPVKPFRFGYVFRCVSLGRHDGVIQFTDHWDQPASRVITGGLAAWIKEGICKMTYHAPRLELKTGLRLYGWPKPVNRNLPGLAEAAPPRNG